MPSFTHKKRLRFVITLDTGSFGSSNNNQITLEGYRASAVIDKAGGMMMGTLRARIYGVSQSDMNSCTTLQWKTGLLIQNTVQVFAIDGDSESLVFSGNIVNAWGDYYSMPDVFLHIQAQSAYFMGLASAPPLSVKGPSSVSTLMQQIAESMSLNFEDTHPVEVILEDVYLPNTLKEQAQDLARAAGISMYIDDYILAIVPQGAPRVALIPELSAQSGMIGYPTFDGVGVNIKTIFNPAILFGGSVKVTSDIKQASGEWIVTSISHILESEKPHGLWISQVRGNAVGLAIT